MLKSSNYVKFLLVIVSGLFSTMAGVLAGCTGTQGMDDYIGAPAVLFGQVLDAGGTGIPGAALSTADGLAATTTDCGGDYELRLPGDWSGTVTVSLDIDRFAPISQRYSHLRGHVRHNFKTLLQRRPPDSPIPCPTDPNTPSEPQCRSDADCDDGLFCNGVETCDAVMGCLDGFAVPCDDGVACTTDLCDEALRGCQNVPDDVACDDGRYCNGAELCGAAGCVSIGEPCDAGTTCDESSDTCRNDSAGSSKHVDDDGRQKPDYDSAAPIGSRDNPFVTIQDALGSVKPGDTIIVHAGRYTSGSSSAGVPIISIPQGAGGEEGKPVTVRAADGEAVILDGENRTRDLVLIGGKYVDIEGLELTGAQRTAIEVGGSADTTHHVNVRKCYAHDNTGDTGFIGAAFRTLGPVRHVTFEDCISARNSGGFQFRESPTQNAGSALVPPAAGNTGFSADLPEADWDEWEGWTDIAARHCTIRRCLAFDNRLIDEHSDGIASRYSVDCLFEDNIAFGNSDDGFDLLGAVRCTARGNIAFAANPDRTADGDGNGIKIGVRGGLDNVAYGNLAFDNPRAGIDLADTERARAYHNTCYNNGWNGIWSEAARAKNPGIILMNNFACKNAKDIAISKRDLIQTFDYNAVCDGNDHGYAAPAGAHGLTGVDPKLRSPSTTVNTGFPAGSSITEKLAFIRNQVLQKLTPSSSSPLIDAGAILSDMGSKTLGTAPDIGGIEAE